MPSAMLHDLTACRFSRIAATPAAPGWWCYNPSILLDGDHILAIVRSSSYSIGRNSPPPIASRSVFVRMTPGGQVLEQRLLAEPSYPKGDLRCQGLEDCRLYRSAEGLLVSATVLDAVPGGGADMGCCRVCIARFDGTALVNMELAPALQRNEKNWMPVAGRECWIHSCWREGMTLAAERVGAEWRFWPTAFAPREAMGFRGGTQLAQVPGGYLAVVHEVQPSSGPLPAYQHRFVRFGPALDIQEVSEPFFFRERAAVEFAAGIAVSGDRVFVSFGLWDAEAWLVECRAHGKIAPFVFGRQARGPQ